MTPGWAGLEEEASLAGKHGCQGEGSFLFWFSSSEVSWGPSTGGLTASGKAGPVPWGRHLPWPEASLGASEHSTGRPGGGTEGGFLVPAMWESVLRVGAQVPVASKGVPLPGSRALPEFSEATQQMLLDKQGTYKLLTFLFPATSPRGLELTFSL